MAYGHREKGSCVDIELVVPPAAGSAPAITSAADTMKFLGKTPLTAAVRQAAEALRYTGREVDGHPDHRRHRDLRGRSLRARQGVGSSRRRLHRPCRRLRPDRGRGQGGRLPRRKHRRQISAGVRRGSACGCADGDGRRAGAGRGSARTCTRPGAARRRGTGRRRACPEPAPEAGQAGIQLHAVAGDGRGRRAAGRRRTGLGNQQGQGRRQCRRLSRDRIRPLQGLAGAGRLCRSRRGSAKPAPSRS